MVLTLGTTLSTALWGCALAVLTRPAEVLLPGVWNAVPAAVAVQIHSSSQ